ncbi:MAG: VWA domain-containing protein [Acidobacteriaceae bacterium]
MATRARYHGAHAHARAGAMQAAEKQVRRLVDIREPAYGVCEDRVASTWLGACKRFSAACGIFTIERGAGRKPGAWLTVRTFLALGLCIFLVTVCRAQDPLDDVHVVPAPPAPAATSPAPDAKTPAKTPTPLEGTKALSARPNERMRVNVNLVLVPVTVTDPLNRLVTGLEKQDFFVYENNALQQLKSFSAEDAPVSIGIIFDLSGSMTDKINRARNSILEFLRTANPQDEFFVIGFNDRPELITDFTNNIDNIETRLLTVKPGHRTALLDAIYFGLNKMKQAKNERKALLVVSDGGDNRSRYTESEVRSVVRESDVQIYSIGIFDQYAPTREEQLGPILLHDVSEETGGQLFRVDDLADMADIATKISAELRNQYVLGYRSDDIKRDGKWRKLKVKLVPPVGLPQLTVHARTGYYAPLQ